MPLLLRKIRKARWDEFIDAPQASEEIIKNGPLADLRQKEGDELSVWRIEDDRSNFDRVVAGFAAMIHPSHFDYLLFDDQLLTEAGIESKETDGDSLDPGVVSYHRDLLNLTEVKRIKLAMLIHEKKPILIDRVPKEKIIELVLNSVAARHLDSKELNKNKYWAKEMATRLKNTKTTS